MKYEKIEVEKEGKVIIFYFVNENRKRPFYEFTIGNKKEWWIDHLSKKMWFSRDVKNKTIELLKYV